MCRNFTGDEHIWWVEDFKKRYATKPFSNSLFLNCGNGRMEREFIDKQIVKQADAFDYSKSLLKEAEKQKGERQIHYFQADANTLNLPNKKYDLIVNVASLHHVQYINKLVYQMGRSLTNDGVLVNFDYIGPHRNLYPHSQWQMIKKINNALPDIIHHDKLLYPSVPVMLKEDPTEAIHSELIIETIKRYFTIIERHDTGGGIAYPLFTHNVKIHNKGIHSEIIKVLKLDQENTLKSTIPVLFSYFIAKPNQQLLSDKQLFAYNQKREDKREKVAQFFGGVYRIQDFMALIIYMVKNHIKKLII